MERNRVLWVIFSISLFLVVVLGVGLYLLRPVPEQGPEVAAEAAAPPGGFDAFEYVRGRGELPGVGEPVAPEDMVIVVGEPGRGPAVPGLREPAVAPAPQPVAPALAAPKAAAAPAGAGTRAAAPKAAVEKPRAPSPAPAKTVNEYWIQMLSVSSLSRAEEAVRSLAEQGLAAMVTTREMSGKIYYRVRVGPYPTRAEAEKFLQWVRALKGYESSYISMVSARRPAR